MRKHYLLLLAFCILSTIAHAQYGWRELGTGANALNANALYYFSMAVDTIGNIYVGGIQVNGDDSGVWKWDGNTWSLLDNSPVNVISICSDKHGNIYATYYDNNNFVSEWNGNAWIILNNGDSILNLGAIGGMTSPGAISVLCTDNSGNLYAAVEPSLTPTDTSILISTFGYVAKWDGNSWTLLGTDSSSLNAAFATNALYVDLNGYVYVGGTFYSDADNQGSTYVAFWNGTAWNQLGSWGPFDGNINSLYVDNKDRLFAGASSLFFWDDGDGLWDSYSSDPLIYNSNNVFAVSGDDSTNIYFGGTYRDSVGYYYVAKVAFDSSPIELGSGIYSLRANSYIQAICSDHKGNIFAAGLFTDATGYEYVAEYGLLPRGQFYVFLNSTAANCNAEGSVRSSIYYGTPPFTYLWNNSDTTANLLSVTSGNYWVTVTDSLGIQVVGHAYVGYACNSIISGITFNDINNNCIYDSTDILLPGQIVEIQSNSGTSYYSTSNVNGRYAVEILDSGTFQFGPTYFTNSCEQVRVCSSQDTFYLPNLGDTLNNINLAIGSSAFDLTLHPGWTSADPGFTKQYWVMPYNLSATSLTGQATITFTYDPNLVYQSSQAPLPSIDTIMHTLTWVINGSAIPYPSFDWYNERFISNFLVPSTLNPNYQLQSDFVIEPTRGDCDTLNNRLYFSQIVTGSRDPNSKQVSPTSGVTSNDSVLTYTIHYQNTGTDSTNFIIVKDTLSPYLNPSSVINLASSDKYSSFNVSGTGILTWTFNPLRIPDSSTNNATSKGFIMFSVRQKANLPADANITNSATIYFDYNTGVVTNITSDTVYPIPVATITANGLTTFCEGDSLILTSLPFSSYRWSNGLTTQSIIITSPGSFSVVITDSNDISAISSAMVITVNPNPPTPTITPSGSTTFCQGDSVTLISSSSNTYLWTGGSSAQSISVYQSGIFSVTASDINSCSAVSSPATITVNPNPSIPNIVFAGNTLFGAILYIPEQGYDYRWFYSVDSVAFDVITSATSDSLLLLDNGFYYVAITDSNGCSAFSVPRYYLATGIRQITDDNSVIVYPNPATGLFNIVVYSAVDMKLNFSANDLLGNMITTRDIEIKQGFNSSNLDLSVQPSGIYILRIKNETWDWNTKLVKN